MKLCIFFLHLDKSISSVSGEFTGGAAHVAFHSKELTNHFSFSFLADVYGML